MLTLKGTYQKGSVTLEKKIITDKKLKVLITFLDDIETKPPSVPKRRFSFHKSRELLKDYSGSLSDALIEERRSE